MAAMENKLGKMLVQVLQKKFYNHIFVRNVIFLLDANFSQMKSIGYIQTRGEHFCVLQALESKNKDIFSIPLDQKNPLFFLGFLQLLLMLLKPTLMARNKLLY